MPSLDDYDIGEFLGSGGFASVHRARCRRTGKECAVKIVDKAVMKENSALHRVRNEMKLHRLMEHPHIVRFDGQFEDEQNVYMVLEVCQGGNLFKYLRNMGPMAEEMAGHVTRQILLAVDYMHRKGVVHRDLKLSNILVSDPAAMVVKLCDFGLAVQLQHPDEEHFTLCGTPNYIAPEIAGQSAYGYPADLWSVGCLFYCMVTGASPFEQQDVTATLQRILTGQYAEPTFLSAEALDFLHQLLQMDPARRANAQQISKHPFIAQCSATAEGMARIARKLASVASSVEGVGGKKRRKSRQSRSDGSFVRSSGDDTEQQGWSSLRETEGSTSQSLAVPLKRSNSSPNTSMASSASSRSSPSRGQRGSGGSSRVRDPARRVSSDSAASASDAVRLQYLLSSKEAERTVDLSLQPKQEGGEPQSWRRALESSSKGKVDAPRSELSSSSFSHGYLYNLAAVSRSVNSTVDSAASMLYCHAKRNIFSSPPAPRSEGSAKPPLLHPPRQQAVLHCSSGGDLLICSTAGDVTFFTLVDTAAGSGVGDSVMSTSVLLRLTVQQCHRTKVSVCRSSKEMSVEYERILEESRPSMGFSFLSPTESDSIVNNCLCASSPAERTYSLRDVPGWITPKYNKICRILDSVKCRIPKLILYVSTQAALRKSGSVGSNGSSASPLSERGHRSVYCKCMLMSNTPLPDFCVQWADGVKLRYSLKSGRLHLSSPNDPPRMPLYQWDGGSTSDSEGGNINGAWQPGVPSWTATAPESVKEYLLVAQLAMQRCLEEKDANYKKDDESGRNNENERMVFI